MARKNIFDRARKLVGMTSQVAAKELALKLSKLIKNNSQATLATHFARIEQVRVITQNLAQLKGAAMKAGQLLSLDSSDFLPQEAKDILSQLQSMAEPEKFEIIEGCLRRELREDYDLIQDLSTTPLAAASIGQVHRGRFQHQEIVLKVQYPNISESIDSDLKILQKLAELFFSTRNPQIDLTETFAELKFVLHQESDYLHEYKMLQLAHNNLQDNSFFKAPRPISQLSTQRILAMEFCEGIPLNQWLSSSPPKSDRDLLARKILDLFLIEFIEWGCVQTDPNFGNYLIQIDPLRLILLDFGSTLTYSPKFIKEYIKTISVADQGTIKEVFKQSVSFGLLDHREGPDLQRAFYDLMIVSLEPFLSPQQPFKFSSLDYEKRSKKVVLNFVKKLQFSPPPRKVIFLHRKLGGIFNLLKRLQAELDLSIYWQQLQEQAQKLKT